MWLLKTLEKKFAENEKQKQVHARHLQNKNKMSSQEKRTVV